MAGPLPPAIGGMTSVIGDLYESRLRDTVRVDLFNTAKQTPPDRSMRHALYARVRLWRSWWSALRSDQPCIAHIHTCSGLSYFLDGALVLTARMRGVPVVLHIHGGRFDLFLDGLDPLRRWFARFVARRAARVVVLSDAWRERLAPRLPGVRLSVVENGVPLTAPVRATESPPIVVFLGAICRAKGVEDLVRAAARIECDARIVLVGPETEPGYLTEMQRLIEELGVAKRVAFPGPCHGADKFAWLARASVFALPSHSEAMPISILEAMSAGCPVVATPVGAVPTVIRHGETGLLVRPGDPAELASAIDRLLRDIVLRDRLAAEARRQCVERFSIERTADKIRGIYAELC